MAAMMEAGQYDAVVVFSDDEEVLGVLLRDAVMRLSPRLPEAPVRLLPLQRTRALGPDLSHADAEALIEGGEIDAVLVEQLGAQRWSVLLRA
ncbi:MAG: hypothetical protein U0228_01790 [Myxococcaceae bacterium]